MSQQPELAAAADTPTGTDPFAAARARFPEARLLLLLDRRPGNAGAKHMLAVPPSSPWHALLPPEQICDIHENSVAEHLLLADAHPTSGPLRGNQSPADQHGRAR